MIAALFGGLWARVAGVAALVAGALGALWMFGRSKRREGYEDAVQEADKHVVELAKKADAARRDPDAFGVRKFDRD